MRDNKIRDAYETIQPDYFAKQRVWNKVTTPKPKRKRHTIPVMAAMAAVLAIMVFVHSLLPTQIVNSFTIRAYAIEQQADGTITQREVDLASQTGVWGGLHDGEILYLNIGLDVLGENIESVEFAISEGFFAKQYIDPEAVQAATDGRMALQVTDGESGLRPAVFGAEFEPLGQRIALDDIQAENLLLFVAVPLLAVPGEFYNTPDYVDILVHVVFADGERQTETVTLNFGDRMGVIVTASDPDFMPEPADWSSIDLNDLTLIPESVTILTPYDDMELYVWEFENGSTLFADRRDFEETDIQIRGMARIGTRDGNVVLAVIYLIGGDLVGKEYVVPEHIAREFGFE